MTTTPLGHPSMEREPGCGALEGRVEQEAVASATFDAPPLPRVLLGAALVTLVVGLTLLFVGAWSTGISYDEPYHVLRLQHFFDHGWYLLADDLVDGQPGGWVHDTIVYAPLTTLLLHGLNLVAGNDSPGVVSFSAEAFAVRHVGVALISLPAVVATAALTRLVLGSWRWAVVAAGVLVAMPLWTGHAMVNVKDVPVATGYTLVTLALAILVARPRATMRERWGTHLLLVSGLILAVGTRPGIWPGVVASVGVVALSSWVLVDRTRAARLCVTLGLALAAAYAVLWFVYPEGFSGWRWLFDSVFSSANYTGVKSPRASLLGAVVRDVPLLLLVTGVVGLLVFLRRVPLGAYRTRRGVLLVLLLSQALLIPLMAAANGSTLHGLRQMLFGAPAVAVLLTLGVARGYPSAGRATRRDRPPPVLRGVVALFCVAMLLPVLDQLRLFPYSYSYASVVAAPPQWNVGTDQWRTSVRELEPSVPEGMFVVCTPVIADSGALLRHSIHGGRSVVERSRDCRTDDLSPLRPYRLPEGGLEDEPVGSTFAAVVTVPPTQEPTNCRRVGEVTRPRHFVERFMSAVYRCSLVLLPAPEAGVSFDGDGSGSEFLMGGWTGGPATAGARLLDRRGDVGFAWPGGERPERFVLRIEAEVLVATSVFVNNTEVGLLDLGVGRHRVAVSGLPRSELDDAGVVVTFRSERSGGVLLKGVSLERSAKVGS